MDSHLQQLVGREVTSVLSDGSLHLRFDDGSVLAIFNSRSWTGRTGSEGSWPPGCRCLEVAVSPSDATLRFDDGATLTIDLRDNAFSGPEAMVFSVPDGPIVVWN